MKTPTTLVMLALIAVSATARADDTATVAHSDAKIDLARRENIVLLHAEQAARAFGWEAKLEQSGKLLIICRAGDAGVCIPIRLEALETARTESGLFVDARALSKALRFRIVEEDDQVTLVADKVAAEDDDLPAYNANWGAGRGLRVGQTLPDIPLYDLEGHEVRFSQFLGKQCLIYCWASW